MNEEYIANAERRRKIADDMAWSSGYAAGRAAGLRLREAAQAVVDAQPMDWEVAPEREPGKRHALPRIEVNEHDFDALMDAIDALRAALATEEKP